VAKGTMLSTVEEFTDSTDVPANLAMFHIIIC
jgi:hypothetical protein